VISGVESIRHGFAKRDNRTVMDLGELAANNAMRQHAEKQIQIEIAAGG
jgi:hypothetical protein